jgi:hypothetical protein
MVRCLGSSRRTSLQLPQSFRRYKKQHSSQSALITILHDCKTTLLSAKR